MSFALVVPDINPFPVISPDQTDPISYLGDTTSERRKKWILE